MIKLFGISNCDKVRKARAWLDEAGITFRFYDFRKAGLERARVVGWYNKCGDTLVNRRSATWRQLSEADRERPVVDLLLQYPTLIQRPVIQIDDRLLINFSNDSYTDFFKDH